MDDTLPLKFMDDSPPLRVEHRLRKEGDQGQILHTKQQRKKRSFSGESDGKEYACSAGALGSIPGSERSPEEGNGNPLQHSCLGNPMDRGVWWATVHGATVRHDLVLPPPPPGERDAMQEPKKV